MIVTSRTRRAAAILAALLLFASCGDDDSAGSEDAVAAPDDDTSDGGAEDADAESAGDTVPEGESTGGTGTCDDLGPEAFLEVQLGGAVNEAIGWAAPDMDCSGSSVRDLTLGWTMGDLDVLLRGVEIGQGETGVGRTSQLVINAGTESFIANGCTVDIDAYDDAELPDTFLVKGSATCPDATQVGGDGSISVAEFRFAGYALG